ncbi:MAG: carbohydrate binding family 9 domain-containing protein, partial [Bacteroidota bacterium]
MSKIKSLLAPLLLVFVHTLSGQNLPDAVDYNIQPAAGSIQLDGKLNEDVWQNLPKAGGFYQTFPTDNQPAKDSTQFMITYTDRAVVFGIICWDSIPGPPISTTRRRDFEWSSNDNVSVYIDPYNDKTNGFAFQVTPFNVQREGLVLIGGSVYRNIIIRAPFKISS